MTSSIPIVQTLATVEYFRKLVRQHFSKFIEKGDEYDERDIQRFNEEDEYTLMFIRHGQYGTTFNEIKALQYFNESMSWRKENKIYDISKTDFPADYFERHAIYYKNHDINNNPILYFAFRTIVKGHEDLDAIKRFIIYRMEEHLQSHIGQSIVILFDMTDTSLKHLDYDLAKFIVCITQIYYPGLVLYILVYTLPLILTTSWEIIRSWLLPEAQQTIKFVDAKSITQFIQSDQLPMTIDTVSEENEFKYRFTDCT